MECDASCAFMEEDDNSCFASGFGCAASKKNDFMDKKVTLWMNVKTQMLPNQN